MSPEPEFQPKQDRKFKTELVESIEKCSFNGVTTMRQLGAIGPKKILKGLAKAERKLSAESRARVYSSWLREQILVLKDDAIHATIQTFVSYLVESGLPYGEAVGIWESRSRSVEHLTPPPGTPANRDLLGRIQMIRKRLLQAYSYGATASEHERKSKSGSEDSSLGQGASSEEATTEHAESLAKPQIDVHEKCEALKASPNEPVDDARSSSRPTCLSLKRKSPIVDLTEDASDECDSQGSEHPRRKSTGSCESNAQGR